MRALQTAMPTCSQSCNQWRTMSDHAACKEHGVVGDVDEHLKARWSAACRAESATYRSPDSSGKQSALRCRCNCYISSCTHYPIRDIPIQSLSAQHNSVIQGCVEHTSDNFGACKHTSWRCLPCWRQTATYKNQRCCAPCQKP